MSTPEAADHYERMLRLADTFDRVGDDLRARARLGEEVLGDPDVADSADLSRATWAQTEADVRAATTGRHGLLSRSIELDADALVVRATVLTYRWIDELQDAAYRTLGTIAGRAIGYLAPEVALGGAVVSAGLIETDALDRDDVATYLGELAEHNPQLMDHVSSGGGGLLDGLQMRSLLTAGVLVGDSERVAAAGGLRAVEVDAVPVEVGAALRDVAGGFAPDPAPDPAPDTAPAGGPATTTTSTRAPAGLGELMQTLLTVSASTAGGVRVDRVAPGRYIAYLTGPERAARQAGTRRLRLVGGDPAAYTEGVVRAIEEAVGGDDDPRVLLVGHAQGGVTAARLAAAPASEAFTIDHLVTAGAPAAHVPRIDPPTRVLSLEDRTDPVALLGSLVNTATDHRLTVVFEGEASSAQQAYVTGGRAADEAAHPELREEIARLRAAGYLR